MIGDILISDLHEAIVEGRRRAADLKLFAEMALDILDDGNRELGEFVAHTSAEHDRLNLLLRQIHDLARGMAKEPTGASARGMRVSAAPTLFGDLGAGAGYLDDDEVPF